MAASHCPVNTCKKVEFIKDRWCAIEYKVLVTSFSSDLYFWNDDYFEILLNGYKRDSQKI